MSSAPDCPFCGAGAVERVGQWGGQIITAQWRCQACNTYFEAVREDFDDGKQASPASLGASVIIRRRIEWMDTDAAGIYHWTTVFRLAEAAEAELHTQLGIAELTFGATPRLSVSAEFKRSLRFNDEVDVELIVEHVGRTSIRYRIVVTGPEGVAAEAGLTACLIDRETRRPTPWPNHARRLLLAGD
jgi:acyl-CoA thioester hydrolase